MARTTELIIIRLYIRKFHEVSTNEESYSNCKLEFRDRAVTMAGFLASKPLSSIHLANMGFQKL